MDNNKFIELTYKEVTELRKEFQTFKVRIIYLIVGLTATFSSITEAISYFAKK